MKKKIIIFIATFIVVILGIYIGKIVLNPIGNKATKIIVNEKSLGEIGIIDCSDSPSITEVSLELISGEDVPDNNGHYYGSNDDIKFDKSFEYLPDEGMVTIEIRDDKHNIVKTIDVQSGEKIEQKIYLRGGTSYHIKLTADGNFKGYYIYKDKNYKLF